MKKNNVKNTILKLYSFILLLLKALIDDIKKSIIDNKDIFKSFPYYNEH